MLKEIFRYTCLLTSFAVLTGCDYFRDQLYGERGIQELLQRDQHVAFREADLAMLLDPTNQRKAKVVEPMGEKRQSLGPEDTDNLEVRENEIDRALLYFTHSENNRFLPLEEQKKGNGDADKDKKGAEARVEEKSTDSGFIYAARVRACTKPGMPPDESKTPVKYGTVRITTTKVETARQGFDRLNNMIGGHIQKKRVKQGYQLDIISTGSLPAPTVCGEHRVQQLRRNAITERLIAASVQQCEQYKDQLAQFEADTVFAGSLIIAGLGAAGALIDGASQALSAATGGVGTVTAGISQSYFSGRSIGATIKAIDADRIAIRTVIRQGLKQVPEAYPMEQALGDVARYHYACSLRAGLETLDKTAEDRLQAVKAAAATFGTAAPVTDPQNPAQPPAAPSVPADPAAQAAPAGAQGQALRFIQPEVFTASPLTGAGQ